MFEVGDSSKYISADACRFALNGFNLVLVIENCKKNLRKSAGYLTCADLREIIMKAGFVNIFGKPNAGKSTLLNALLGEKMAIVSSKVHTTRHRIKAFLNKPGEYQVIF